MEHSSENHILNKRKLGNTDIYLTEIGYGCASLWGKKTITDHEAEELFLAAYNNGIRFYDTGYSYGYAEERLGQCMKHLPSNARKELVISTKCGTRRNKNGKYVHDWSDNWLKKSVKISLERLGIEYIDLLHVHGPAISEVTPEMLKFLDKLKEKGIVRATGINTFDTDVIEWVVREKNFDFVMLDYNIMRQDREDTIDRLYGSGIGVIAGAPLAQNLYSNRVYKVKNVKDLWYLLRAIKNFRGHMVEGRKYRFVNEIYGMTGNQVALRYVLENEKVASAVFGSVAESHIVENIKSAHMKLPYDTRFRIKELGKGQNNRNMDRH